MAENKILIKLEDVKKYFPLKKSFEFKKQKKFVKAVDGVSIDIYENETLGLVGESGSGKSTLGKSLLQLDKPTSGKVLFQGENLCDKSANEMRKLRQQLQIVFQDPYSSLNPRLTVGKLVSEAVVAHGMFNKNDKALERYTIDIMEKCGLQPFMYNRYPHEFSGGQRQRIGIARALALNPKFIVCDECVSTLDVSIQSQIINLLLDLKQKNNLTYLFISHNLNVIRFISNRIAVMYLGRIIELADTETLFEKPLHPYTKALLNAVPTIDNDNEQRGKRRIIEGDVPSPIDPPKGCSFNPRCRYKTELCETERPIFVEREDRHFVACHHPINE